MNKYILLISLTLLLISQSCLKDSGRHISLEPENLVEDLLTALINAREGDVIELPEGRFVADRPLSMNDIPKVTIKGKGKHKTIFNFKDQKEGAEGFLFKNTDFLTLEGFGVEDAKGDGIKVQNSRHVTMRDLLATWTGGALPTNGAYGLYPVTCEFVLMEDCEASYSMDAGIYVGQSRNVLVRNNYAHHNVIGIEIENTQVGRVYGNKAEMNTGGMFIFDMPDLPQANGYRIKVYDNEIVNNNHPNFAPEGIVANIVPVGTGVLILAEDEVEFYGNRISRHNTLGLGILSWIFTDKPYNVQSDYDPYCSSIEVFNNSFYDNEGLEVDQSVPLGRLLHSIFEGVPVDIVVDGIFDPEDVGQNEVPTGAKAICIYDNGDVRFRNLRAARADGKEGIASVMDDDMDRFACDLETLDVFPVDSVFGEE